MSQHNQNRQFIMTLFSARVQTIPRQFINYIQQRLAYSKHNALVNIGSSNGLAPDMHHAIA